MNGDGRRGTADALPLLDIVIPALNEADALPHLLEDIALLPVPHRVVVVDGGSTDDTPRYARACGAELLEGLRGRARQMNTGAAEGNAPWILFLHADVRIPPAAREALASWLPRAGPAEFATFAFALEGRHWFWRFIELGQRIRERLAGLAYGDQGLVVSRTLFCEAGGFPDLPLMEDVEILRALRRKGRWRNLPAPLLASPRRYREEGRWRSWLRNSALIALYLAGVSPRRLARFYPARRPLPPPAAGRTGTGGGAAGRTLLVFAKAPRPGKVKTRLAAEVGPRAAAEIYRAMGSRVVEQLRGGGYRILVCFDPPTARAEVQEWLGEEGIGFRPQHRGDLGARLEAAFAEAFEESEVVVVVGTDAPDVDRALVEDAFRRLASADLVLGPAADGGYYLLGLRRPVPELFRGVPWSTPEVLEATRARARDAGLVEAILPTLSDVDTRTDWERMGVEHGRLAPPSSPASD